MPIGFKNRTDGNIQVAVDAVRAAAAPHAFAGIDDAGQPAILHTTGNPDCHIILRGGHGQPNYHVPEVEDALVTLGVAGLPERLVIDASHDNSAKDPEKQFFAAGEIADQIADGNKAIVGVMLESFLKEGRQDLRPGRGPGLRAVGDRPLHRLGGHGHRAGAVRLGGRGAAHLSEGPRVAILGVGLIGGSIGLAARRRLGAEVVGWGRSPERIARAVELGALDRGADSVEAACAGADLVFCAGPVGLLPEQAAAALAASGEDTVVSDVGSTKGELVDARGGDERFIGGHPLAGAETAGVENAREDLFEGARWYLTPTERSSGLLYDRLQRAVAGLGARPLAIDPHAHDRMMATVSHLPHVVANALAAEASESLTRDSERLPEIGPSFRDTTRVAGSNPAIWADIFASNRDAVADSVESVARRLEAAARLIRAGDRDAVAAWHAAAGEDRRRLLESELAAGPLRELRIVVANRPGTIAELALALGEAGVNIEDMALYPAADMTSGAVTLWVAGDEQAARAADLIHGLGHTVSVLDGE